MVPLYNLSAQLTSYYCRDAVGIEKGLVLQHLTAVVASNGRTSSRCIEQILAFSSRGYQDVILEPAKIKLICLYLVTCSVNACEAEGVIREENDGCVHLLQW